ncbi:DMT family transporter [Sulfitobacter mediterraneus]|uniref:DMT family transporter n=1 Tax=Sulfitobacter mediterraneus TaxID=83219 RepID=UPI0021A6FD53|nr:DMT family transporter [Sulfitobacter mediterraneus]UWR11850.1 DMT family transporter [Sulfitobacter mediterraneus]
MIPIWIVAALATASCFAVSGLLAYDAARALGATVFSFVRMALVAIGAGGLVLLFGLDSRMNGDDVALLCASGVMGVFLSDTLRYASLSRVGPQLQSLLGTATAPFALLLGFLVLGQTISMLSLVGTGMIIAGLVAAASARNNTSDTRFTGDTAGLTPGIGFGLGAALTQAGSVLIAAPVMAKGIDPLSATFVRSVAGALSLLLPVLLSAPRRSQIQSMTRPVAKQVVFSAVVGTGLGMSLQLFALASGPVGIVATLSATTPLIVLPLIWIIGRSRPKALAWLGAVIGVAGVALISNAP